LEAFTIRAAVVGQLDRSTAELVVLTLSCTFNPPTSNGSVPQSGFSCSS
jgi:hypothetical protein